MDEIKGKATERITAINGHVANASTQAIERLRLVLSNAHVAVLKVWNNELSMDVRMRVVNWTNEATRRIREGSLPLHPKELYRELVIMFKDRVWKKSVMIFACGFLIGAAGGTLLTLQWAGCSNVHMQHHCRALVTQTDGSVSLETWYGCACVSPGSNTVSVRVRAVAVSTEDRAALRGRGSALRSLLEPQPQVIVGRAFAGVVLESGDDSLEAGTLVWGICDPWRGGAARELCTVRCKGCCKRPLNADPSQAAAIAASAPRAIKALKRAKMNAESAQNRKVLIVGASSPEGCCAIQLLSKWGAAVSCVAPLRSKPILVALGAAEILTPEDARTRSWSTVIVFGLSGGPRWSRGAIDARLKPLISDTIQPPLGVFFTIMFTAFRVCRWCIGCGWDTDWLDDDWRPTLDEIAPLVESRDLQAVVDKIFTPEEFESALSHACSEESIGSTVIHFP